MLNFVLYNKKHLKALSTWGPKDQNDLEWKSTVTQVKGQLDILVFIYDHSLNRLHKLSVASIDF